MTITEVYDPEYLAFRFWRQVDKTDGAAGCWPWRGLLNHKGYGSISITIIGQPRRGLVTLAHRIAYLLAHGTIDDALMCCHTCDTPACCNPAHLWLGTNRDNMRDRERKERTATGVRASGHIHRARIRRRRGQDHGSAKLCEEDVHEIRARSAKGETYTAISKTYGVTPENIRIIAHGANHPPTARTGRTYRAFSRGVRGGACHDPASRAPQEPA